MSSERHKTEVEAEVVGFSGNNVLLMALDSIHLIHPGCKVISRKNSNVVPSGIPLLEEL